MSILDVTITREEWFTQILNKSGSDNSLKTAKTGIKKWDQYLDSLNENDANVLKLLREHSSDPKAYQFLNKFVQWLISQKIAPSSNKIFFAVMKSWVNANGIMLHQEYVKQFIKFPKKVRETRQPLTLEIIKLLINNAPKKIAVVLYILLSSGMRISECLQLQVRDINQNTNPIEIRIRAETTKTLEERMAFISNEAWEKIQPLISDLEQNDTLFFCDYNKNSLIDFEIRFGQLRKHLGLVEKYANGKNYHVNVHAFRAYFLTQATRILDGDIAHALVGHHQYLDQYLRLSPQEKSEMYHKLEPYVTVSDESRLRTIVEDKDSQLKELSQMQKEILELKAFKKRQEDKKL